MGRTILDSPLDTNPAGQSASAAALLNVLAEQIRCAMAGTQEPMQTLVATVHDMQEATRILALGIMDFSDQPARVFEDLMTLHNDLSNKSAKSITAVQFHDRHVQVLTRVCAGLSFMADAMSGNDDALSASDWAEINVRVRGMLGMEQNRDVFDRVSDGSDGSDDAMTHGPTIDIF
jgi:hypothetical protein